MYIFSTCPLKSVTASSLSAELYTFCSCYYCGQWLSTHFIHAIHTVDISPHHTLDTVLWPGLVTTSTSSPSGRNGSLTRAWLGHSTENNKYDTKPREQAQNYNWKNVSFFWFLVEINSNHSTTPISAQFKCIIRKWVERIYVERRKFWWMDKNVNRIKESAYSINVKSKRD